MSTSPTRMRAAIRSARQPVDGGEQVVTDLVREHGERVVLDAPLGDARVEVDVHLGVVGGVPGPRAHVGTGSVCSTGACIRGRAAPRRERVAATPPATGRRSASRSARHAATRTRVDPVGVRRG